MCLLKRILALPLTNVCVVFFLFLGDSDRHVIRFWLLAVILVCRDALFRGDVPLFLRWFRGSVSLSRVGCSRGRRMKS